MAPKLSKEFRYKILERDNFRCRFCDRGGKHSDYILEVHHIVWRRHGGSDNPANLMTICKRCHMILHYGRCPDNVALTFSELRNGKG